ncbi:MAG: N-acetylneuraminate synthase family protein [Treponema sp.]|jgi:sialic acid synthase SpsE|nr:N-acetylneuraminate synthase family protein [Treponema sp.]
MEKDFIIDGTVYSAGKSSNSVTPCNFTTAEQPLIIAEIGTSHGTDPVKARELVDAAAMSGAGCVKFQMVYAEEILHPNTGDVLLPGGLVRLYDTFKCLEVPPSFYADIKDYAESKGLLFLCTPFGPRSARELWELRPKAFKIASPEINYTALVKQVAGYGLPVFLSTGVAKLGDIEETLEFFSPEKVCLLHCVTAYPAPEKNYNLRTLESLGAVFGTAMGVSDHSTDPELVPALAAAMGAAAIEKHFCLSRSDPGLDDPIALTPDLFARMVRAVTNAAAMDLDEVIAVYSQERGDILVNAVLGDGVKRLAPSEMANYRRTNRSIHAMRDIAKGEVFEAGMIRVLRTEKILRPGLPPSWAEKIIGRKARRFIPDGEGIGFEDC